MAGLLDQRFRGHGDLDFGAGREDRDFGVSVAGGDLVSATGAEVALDEFGALRWQALAGERKHARRMAAFQRQLPAFCRLGGVGRAEDD